MNNLNQPPVIENNPNPNDQKGASLVEYALLIALVAVVAISAMRGLGNRASASFSQVSSSMTFAAGGPVVEVGDEYDGDVIEQEPDNGLGTNPPRN
jgi:pilus assembly protein Flp/PilA